MIPPGTVPDVLVLFTTVLGVFVATTVLVMALTTPVETPAMRLVRFAKYTGRRGSPGAEVEQLSARERLLLPLWKQVIAFAARAAPSQMHRAVEADLTMAGSRMSPTAFLGIRTLLMVGAPVLGVLYALTSGPIELLDWVVVIFALVWGRQVPAIWLRRRIRARQRAIDRRLPYALDLMVACLEGGLSIDAALAKVVEQSEGPLPTEIRKTLQELALGRPTAEAIRDLGERAGAPGLKRLTEDIVQSERMGISIAESLRNLARDARTQRRQHAEELARKAPIKMVPVLIFCVLPALGIVTTAPAVILLVRTLARSTSLP